MKPDQILYHFVHRSGRPSITYNRVTGAPFPTIEEATTTFLKEFPEFKQISLGTFSHSVTGEVVQLAEVVKK